MCRLKRLLKQSQSLGGNGQIEEDDEKLPKGEPVIGQPGRSYETEF